METSDYYERLENGLLSYDAFLFERSNDLTKPTTGVMNLNESPDWLLDTLASSVDLSYEIALQNGEINDESELEYWDSSDSSFLVGDWTKNDDGLWSPDEHGAHGFSAIYNGDRFTIQVIWSQTIKRFNRPTFQGCYPGQVDIDSGLSDDESGYLAYCLPDYEEE